MIDWLEPLGFLGLTGILILILIYLLKPNYQQKMISSTFVWKMSLKYKKKRIPISRFRNLIIFLCQLLVLTSCAFIFAQPVIKSEAQSDYPDKIVIIESSANMRATFEDKTRFERAVIQVKKLAEETFKNRGRMTVILADDSPEVYATCNTVETEENSSGLLEDFYKELDSLIEPNIQCSYGTADIDGAIAISEGLLLDNPKAEVRLYTGTKYIDKGKNVMVVDVSDSNEWNGAILNADASLDENFYMFKIEIASYGAADELNLTVEINGVNNGGTKEELKANKLFCKQDETITVIFSPINREEYENTDNLIYIPLDVKQRIYAFDYARVEISSNSQDKDDSFTYDDEVYIYGGRKQKLKLQYISSDPNLYFEAIMMSFQNAVSDWDIEVNSVRGNDINKLPEYEEGYDFYVFEHAMPATLPKDGVVILMDPKNAPRDAGFTVETRPTPVKQVFAPGDPHPVMNGITPENWIVSEYTRVTSFDDYSVLMHCGGDPAFMLRNSPSQKIAVMAFNLNYADVSILTDFPLLMLNLFNYFIPSTVEKYVFDANEVITLNARSSEMTIVGPSFDKNGKTFSELPSKISMPVPGAYTVTQTPLSGVEVTEYFYVKIPAGESNIAREYDVLANPYIEAQPKPQDLRLLIYFAAALVALLFIEWLLQARDHF